MMSGPAITALLIDDHAVVLQGYRTLLEQAGIQVLGTARSTADGLKAFGELRPRVTVTDLAMPDAHGLDVIKSIRQISAAAGILVFSMHDDVVLASRALHAGATAYVTKTSPSLLLVEAVRRVAAGERYLSPDIALKLAIDRTAGQRPAIDALSPREFECFRLIAEGHRTPDVVARMNLSTGTVANLKSRVMRKLGATTTVELIRIGVEQGVVRQNV
ncbi:MAG: response regulator [Gammaproteobacteria bacterium]